MFTVWAAPSSFLQHVVVQAVAAGRRLALPNGPFCRAERAVRRCGMARSGVPNGRHGLRCKQKRWPRGRLAWAARRAVQARFPGRGSRCGRWHGRTVRLFPMCAKIVLFIPIYLKFAPGRPKPCAFLLPFRSKILILHLFK